MKEEKRSRKSFPLARPENEDTVQGEAYVPSEKIQVDAARTEFFRTDLMKSPVPKPSSFAAETHKETASLHLKEAFVTPENHLFIIGRTEFRKCVKALV